MRQFHWNNAVLISLIGLVLGTAVVVTFPLYDPDLYWHLANGREMFNQHRILNEEVFSFTRYGTEFSNHEWLAQLIFSALYEIFGWTGLQLFKIFVGIGVALMLWVTCRFHGASASISALLAFSAILAGAYRYSVRPELFSLIFVAAVGLLLHGYRSNKLTDHSLWALPAIIVVWDWLHGALFGVALITVFTIGENLKRRLEIKYGTVILGNALPDAHLRWLNIWVGITAGCFLLNPYGITSYEIFLEFIRPNPLVASVREFSPPSFLNFLAFWTLAGYTLFVAAARRHFDLSDLLVVLVFLLLALRFSRVIGVFAIVLVPFLSSLLSQTSGTNSQDRIRVRNIKVATVCFGVLMCFVTIFVKFFKPNDILQYGYNVMFDGFPVGAACLVRDVDLRGNMYNSGDFGGYLSFELAPERKIFQYNHHTVFRDTRYYIDHPLELERWNINYTIVVHGIEKNVLFPRNNWAEIYSEPAGSLMIRRSLENQWIIDSYEIHYFRPLQMGFPELMASAQNPAVYPRLMLEMGIYLSCRSDTGIADVFSQFVTDPNGQMSNSQRRQLIDLAMRSNSNHPGLRRVWESLRD